MRDPVTGKWIGKEAAMKALGAGESESVRFCDIEIKRHPTGKPYIFLSPAVRKRLRLPRTCQIELLMSHEREYAIAAVLMIAR